MGSKNCEMSNVKCELGTANCCVALKLAIVTVTGASGRQFCTLLDAFWSVLEAYWTHLGGV